MAAVQRSAVDSPLRLDFKSKDMSLQHGTSFSVPLASPPLTPLPYARPPTPGGGPLSSHPATPVNSSPFSPPPSNKSRTPPRTVSSEQNVAPKSAPELTGSPIPIRSRERIVRKPLSPTSANSQPTPPRRRDSTGVRKLLSLTSLRNSIGGRSSTSLSRSPSTTTILSPASLEKERPPPSYTAEVVGGTKRRPSSPSIMSALTTTSSSQSGQSPAPQLRKRKSGSWFRRKSAMFSFEAGGDGQEGTLRPMDENMHVPRSVSRQELRSDAFEPEHMRPAPSLPEVSTLRGGRLTGGAFAEQDVFTSIGR